MLYTKPKVRLSRAGINDYLLKLGCDCAMLFVSQAIARGMKKNKASWPKH